MILTRALLLIAPACILTAQTGEVVPLPLLDPQSHAPARQLQPGMLTSKEKAGMMLRHLVSPQTAANRFTWAAINHLRDRPEEWDRDARGYGQRLGHRYARLAVRNSIGLGLDVAFKTDPRYDRCECSGFFPRMAHAYKRSVVSRKDYGGEMISPAKLGSAFLTPWITDQWMPASVNTRSHKFESGAMFLTWRANTNLVREFWPEIRRTVFRKKN